MKFSIIFVGDQENKEQNRDFLLSEADALGIEFENSFECEDVSSLQSSLSSALEKSEILFVAGGIGIGKDCFTVSTVSDFLNIPVALNENYVNIIQDKLKGSSYPISESISAAATLPTNCIVLPNDCAIAPGCLFLTSSQYIVLLPSSPFELSTMFKRYALKPLIKFTDSPAAVQYVGCFDPDEQKLAAVCKEINIGFNVKTIICRNGPDVTIQLISSSGSDNINVAASELFSRLKPYSYSDNDLGLVNATVELMTDKYLSLSIAECGTRSYTTDVLTEHAAQKGAVAHSFRLSSDWNDLKNFGISPKLMKKYDIVSEQIAAEMSFIAKENGASQIGLSIVSSQTENSIAERSYLSLCDGEYIWTICVQNQIAPEIFAINRLRLYLSSLLPSGVPVQAALLGTS
ncbi:MAG: hypothetical protein J5874_06205, partial [Oscillospiraceae bacterium]|nr:hypothetical protein [Oscillospiraceae bacterium]